MKLIQAVTSEDFKHKLVRAEKAIGCFFYEMFINREGRISRIQFMFSFGIIFYLYFLAFDVISSVLSVSASDEKSSVVVLLIVLAALFQRPFQALFTKRLHDINQTGWLFFIGMIFIYGGFLVFQDLNAVVGLLDSGRLFDKNALVAGLEWKAFYIINALIFNAVLLMILFLKPGTKGENKYGDDPRQSIKTGKHFAELREICDRASCKLKRV